MSSVTTGKNIDHREAIAVQTTYEMAAAMSSGRHDRRRTMCRYIREERVLPSNYRSRTPLQHFCPALHFPMSFPTDTKHLIVLEPPPVEFEEDYLEPPPSYDYLPEEEGQRSPTHSAHFIESGLGYPYPSSLGTSSSTYLSSPTASARASYVSLSSASHRMSGTPSIDHWDDDSGATGYAPSLTPPSKDAPHPDKVGKLVSGRCPQRLLNPPPPCFSRPRSESMQYPPFPTITVASIGKHYLAKGFPATLPPSETRPHPFATHDVTEEEWMHFLADLKRAAGLGWGDRLVGNVAPLLVGVPYVPGETDLSYIISGYMAGVADCITGRIRQVSRGTRRARKSCLPWNSSITGTACVFAFSVYVVVVR